MFKRSFKMLILMLLLTGIAYPLFVTLIAQLVVHHQANGSFIVSNGKIVGSRLIGQKFDSEKYFWGRPSASDYNALSSGGSNLGPASAVLKKKVGERKAHLRKSAGTSESIPSDLLFASGSGLDPHITIEAAQFQKERISRARGYNGKAAESFDRLIERLIEKRTFGFLGTPHVNVLELNLALDAMQVKL
ncbi:MAG TPA: potassium-transporting ATPase subunit KdpC [Parachlamydiaceae bacterium]|nr:potassium-transporting ATPase subunit KdpC [Parachlamydiaceae bacterium]